jgi:flagellar protein FliS
MVAHGYARAYRRNAVLTATPGQLVLMLFDGALTAMAQAREAFKRPESDYGRLEVINRNLIKAQRILSELRGNLDMEAGGDFANTMHGLYSYHIRRLFEANVHKDEAPVAEVERLVRDVRDAWEQMLMKSEAALREGGQVLA